MAPDPRTRGPHSQRGEIGRASRSRAFARGLGRAGLTGSVRSPPCPGFLPRPKRTSARRPTNLRRIRTLREQVPASRPSVRLEQPRGSTLRPNHSPNLRARAGTPPAPPPAPPPKGPSVQESSLGVVRSGLRDPTRNARTGCEGRAGDTQGDCMSPRGRVPSAIRPSPPAMPPESRHALSAQAQPHQEAPQGRVPGPHENEQGPPDHQPSTPHRPSSGHDLLSRPHQPHRSHRRPAAHRGGVLSFGARTPIEPTDAP